MGIPIENLIKSTKSHLSETDEARVKTYLFNTLTHQQMDDIKEWIDLISANGIPPDNEWMMARIVLYPAVYHSKIHEFLPRNILPFSGEGHANSYPE